jgi:hypothetical protein
VLHGRQDVVGLVPRIDHHGPLALRVADKVAVALELPNDQMVVYLEWHGYSVPGRGPAKVSLKGAVGG